MAKKMEYTYPQLRALGKIFRDKRIELGLNQAEMAVQLNIHQSAVSALETGSGSFSKSKMEHLLKTLDLCSKKSDFLPTEKEERYVKIGLCEGRWRLDTNGTFSNVELYGMFSIWKDIYRTYLLEP